MMLVVQWQLLMGMGVKWWASWGGLLDDPGKRAAPLKPE